MTERYPSSEKLKPADRGGFGSAKSGYHVASAGKACLVTQTSNATTPIVVMRDVSKIFDSGDGVRDLNLAIDKGTIFGFVGPSGSGKTTTVRLLTSILKPSRGSVEVLGERPSEFRSATRNRLGYMPQQSVLYPSLSVWDNLRFFASLYGIGRDRAALDAVLEFVELDDHKHKRVSQISGGMRRRLSLAAALVHDPELIFLDEPTAGIDPVLRRKLWDRFEDLRDTGHTLFVTTQYVGEAAYCDYVGVLADGRLVLVDTPGGLRTAAFGGEVLDVEFTRPPDPKTLADIGELIGASASDIIEPRLARFVLPDVSEILPTLGTWAGEREDLIAGYEQYLPPFDDVFVEVIEQHRAADPDQLDAGEVVRV